jgi:VanZ family protein
MTNTLRRWGPAALMMLIIFAASATPKSNLPVFVGWDWVVKKGGHLTGYALLAALYVRGLAFGRRATWRDWGVAVLLAAFYALTDEFHQLFVPGRGAMLKDVGIDSLGALIGATLYHLYARARLNAGTEIRPPETR